MITQEQANRLLALPKQIEGGDDFTIDLKIERNRLDLFSPDEADWKFVFHIFSNKRITFKISMHHHEDNLKEALLRIDFKGGHRNPEFVNDYVPDFLKPYAGDWFQNEAHIHLFVESYKNLAWAMPLKDFDEFPIKEVHSYPDFSLAIRAFAERINLISGFAIQEPIL